MINKNYPSVLVSISTEITNEYNEYERTLTTVVNALLLNIMNRYLGKLEKEIRDSWISWQIDANSVQRRVDDGFARPQDPGSHN